MKIFRIFAFATFASLLQSCFNSDDHIFDEAEAIDIKIDASLAKNITEVTSGVKADTFQVNDTVYFITTISPNKIIKVQDYHWLMDGNYCSSEYNFKKQLTEPGHHKFTFVLKDHFGDMHYDSLDVWVADNPILNDSVFTPANGTQAIDPFEAIYFTWSAKTEGIKLNHHYRFTLSEQDFANTDSKFEKIDTILYEPNFTFHNKLNQFKKYNWSVQAFNEYNFASSQKIESSFYTKGFPGEGSLQATVDIGQAISVPMHLLLQDKDDSNKHFDFDFRLTSTNNEISLGIVSAGTYQLTLRSDYSDFGTIEKEVKINEGFVTIAKDLKLVDSIAPTIVSTTMQDSLDFADTLQFIVKDGSGAISAQNISVHLENELIFDRFYKDSILTVVLKETDKSWAYRILSISATDGSKNVFNKSFYIMPSILWFTTNNDTTISSNGLINMFIRESNPFGFAVDTMQIFNVTKNKFLISVPNVNTNSFSAELEATLFEEQQTLKSIVIYKNGLRQSKKWNLYVKKGGF
ncbi:hypothetical protein [Fibrobacter sp. UWB11]|uniref:hypothetical protein n=1 Tax=Fibrobacter sp. UWB11 TaxID=1896202 RepID=UPI000926DC98|nr:hypothetical protein [Fibrobacter sp. UWB11]SIN86931.1 hypothetical protein SAMN05720758_0328 [Fibrobacter sp. UWB11]